MELSTDLLAPREHGASTPSVDAARRVSRPAAMALVLAVGLAFADASIVVLGLPEVYADLDTSIVGVSWVITTYAVAVAVGSIAVLIALRRVVGDLQLVRTGAVAFAAASVAAGLAPNLALLLAARAVQGLGGGLLLAGSLGVLAGQLGGLPAARRVWTAAAVVGAAVGPALGGVLTELFAWRSVFLVQAPVAVAAALAVRSTTAAIGGPDVADDPQVRPVRWRQGAAELAVALVFAGGVGALFLGVLVVVEVWRYGPLRGAVAVSSLPLGSLAVRPLASRAARPTRAGAGVALLAAGLVALALLPAASAWWLAAALGLCGAGFGLAVDALDDLALAGSAARPAAARTTAARHAGLVLGLALVAPVLAGALERGADEAVLAGTGAMLDAPLPLADKVRVAWDLRELLSHTPDGHVPDLDRVFTDRGAADGNALDRARVALTDAVEGRLTRAFRSSFSLNAALVAVGILPALLATGAARATSTRLGRRALVGAGVAAVALLSGQAAAGAWDYGRFDAGDPCARPGAAGFEGGGLDGAIQRVVLTGLAGAACELGVSREELVLSLDPDSPLASVEWDRPAIERAVRAGVGRSIGEADERGTIPGWVASALRFAVDRAPISWLLSLDLAALPDLAGIDLPDIDLPDIDLPDIDLPFR